MSISRLEGFAQCPYRHFVNYGLKPVIRREYEFDPADVGDFYHAAMEGYAALALKEPDFPDLPDEKNPRADGYGAAAADDRVGGWPAE